MVEGAINGYFPFRAALEPNRKGSHCLMVKAIMRDATGADGMDTVTVELTRTAEEPDLRVPMDLRRAQAAAAGSRRGGRTSRQWRDGIGSSRYAQPSSPKRAGAGSRKRATCLPLESDGYVVFPV